MIECPQSVLTWPGPAQRKTLRGEHSALRLFRQNRTLRVSEEHPQNFERGPSVTAKTEPWLKVERAIHLMTRRDLNKLRWVAVIAEAEEGRSSKEQVKWAMMAEEELAARSSFIAVAYAVRHMRSENLTEREWFQACKRAYQEDPGKAIYALHECQNGCRSASWLSWR